MLARLRSLLPLVATHAAALQETARLRYDNPTLPRDGRAAIVIRGEAFRCWLEGDLPDGEHRLPCCGVAIPAQEAATASLVKHVIQPLEALGNRVEVVVTDGKCNLTAGSINHQLGGRVLHFEQQDVGGPFAQNKNVRFALDTFKEAVPGGLEGIAKGYDLVLVLRHDTTWKLPIDQWSEANFSKFNFASRCDLEAWDSCINDVFHTMPGHLFPAFDGEVGRGECFSVPDASYCAAPAGGAALAGGAGAEGGAEGAGPPPAPPPSPFCLWNSGHFCAAQVRASVGWQHVGVVTQWRPESRLRDPNGIWELYSV